ncbi:hypothetical protein FHW03_002409 [Ochrobactrum sp. RH2CCR150]|nr:hypothetical protein [Ochrobactrum sp. RH2CCR150]
MAILEFCSVCRNIYALMQQESPLMAAFPIVSCYEIQQAGSKKPLS